MVDINIDSQDLQGRIVNKDPIIFSDSMGQLYQIIKYIPPKDDEESG